MFTEYDSEFKLIQTKEFKIHDHMMIHDWAFTDTHYILFANRVKLDPLGNNFIYLCCKSFTRILLLVCKKFDMKIFLRFHGGDVWDVTNGISSIVESKQ